MSFFNSNYSAQCRGSKIGAENRQIAPLCQQTFCFQKFVDNVQQCFDLSPQVNFPSHYLNSNWKWWDWIHAIFLNLLYFIWFVNTKKYTDTISNFCLPFFLDIRSRLRSGSFWPPPPILNWPKSPHQLGLKTSIYLSLHKKLPIYWQAM